MNDESLIPVVEKLNMEYIEDESLNPVVEQSNMEDESLQTVVEKLNEQINRFDNEKGRQEAEDNVELVFWGLFRIIYIYYSNKQIDDSRFMNFGVRYFLSDITKKFFPDKNLYFYALLLWIRTGFLAFIQSKIPYKGPNTVEFPIHRSLDVFLNILKKMIRTTKDILKDKKDKDDKNLREGTPGLFNIIKDGLRRGSKQIFGYGSEARYQKLLKDAECTGTEGEPTPIFYFLMLHKLGNIAIAIQLIEKKTTSSTTPSTTPSGITDKDLNTIFWGKNLIKERRELVNRILSIYLGKTPDTSRQSSSSGGATSRRRRRRRGHSSLHSRKSINRNKKSKKIRKLYTSKHCIRTRNRNKPKNKSRK